MFRTALALLVLAATPALAATTAPATTPPDRDTAVATLAGLYYSADACNFSISRAKVSAYADAARPAGDALFNVDVFRATQALYAQQKGWTPEQVNTWCATEAATVRSLGMTL